MMTNVIDLEAAKKARRAHWRSWQDIAVAELKPMSWAVEGMQFGPGRPCGIWGYGGSGKTYVAQALGVAVASGQRFLGKFEVRRGLVAHISYELGFRSVQKRYRRLANGMLLEPYELDEKLMVLAHPDMYLNSNQIENWLKRELYGVDLCLIDSLRRALPGADENDSKISNYLDTLARVSEALSMTFVVIHHSGKSAVARTEHTPARGQAGPKDERGAGRGSSAIEDASGAVWKVEGHGNGPRKLVMMRTHEDADDWAAPFHVQLQTVAREHPLYSVDGKPAVRVSCLDDGEVEGMERAQRRRGNVEKWRSTCRDIANAIERSGGSCSFRQALREVGDSRANRAAIDDMVEGNVLSEARQEKGRPRLLTFGSRALDSFLEPDRPVADNDWFDDEEDA